MKKYLIIYFLFALASCSNFLEEYSQDQAYVTGYNDLDELLLGNAYMTRTDIQTYQWGTRDGVYYPYLHFMADETEQYTDGIDYLSEASCFTLFGYYTWQQKAVRNPDGGDSWDDSADWNALYNHINSLNVIISSINDYNGTTDNDIQNISRIKGESLFLRGAYYFVLANLFGDPYNPSFAETALAVPLKTTPYIEDIIYTRSTVATVYQFIVENLLDAEKALEGIEHKSLYRVDVNGVRLLLSRVYLYMQDYENAKIYAQKVLDAKSSLQNLNTFTDEEFLNPSCPELIFSMGSASIPENIAVSTSLSSNDFQVSNDLYNSYEAGDLRTTFYVVKDGGLIYLKKMNGNRFETKDLSDNFILRTSEAYLNLAESAAFLNDDNTAKQALNDLRSNRFASDLYDDSKVNNLTHDELIYFIRDERRRELCLEGHRWFDLRRYNVVLEYPNTKTLKASYTYFELDPNTYSYIPSAKRSFVLAPGDPAYTLPIPQFELEYNKGMKDNSRDARDGFNESL
ncbi:RagB/SusD family nutrient uptake outer membrane protein [Labilibaculum sp. K2S]|uniref:RagB/SusD family nutrient uptake outer membrane protein n=1 Tax=Labilibaculum sp. K2S TaxID=3056386 RepID=UPI0025A396CF|nr:RagB/SusD family nutrient uptake outer membrane protein [Labilibaculum sp. K2S]MDM8158456.1 RagB/SusD family nutrient uptake outer membrane protein [Labilibaculum sp. K2S]